jgi:hypothetical protein
MTKGTVAHRREIFIKAMITANSIEDQIAAYKKAFPQCKKDQSARANSYKLLQNAIVVKAIEEGRRRREEEIMEVQREERIRLAKLEVAHEVELDAQLSKIALGRITRKVKRPVRNRETGKIEIATFEEEPSETDMIAAADKLYRRKGSYAPTTLKHEGGDTFLEFMKELAKAKAAREQTKKKK